MKWSLVYGSMAKMVREPDTVGMKRSLVYGPMAKSYNGRTGYEPKVIMVGSGYEPQAILVGSGYELVLVM